MADLMTAIADMVQGIAAFMGINMTTGKNGVFPTQDSSSALINHRR